MSSNLASDSTYDLSTQSPTIIDDPSLDGEASAILDELTLFDHPAILDNPAEIIDNSNDQISAIIEVSMSYSPQLYEMALLFEEMEFEGHEELRTAEGLKLETKLLAAPRRYV